MQPGRYDLRVYRGDTFRWTFVLWLDRKKAVPMDLAGATVKAEIRNRPAGATVIPLALEIELPNRIAAELTAAASSSLPVGLPQNMVWDLQITLPNTDVNTILRGDVVMTTDVTASRSLEAAA